MTNPKGKAKKASKRKAKRPTSKRSSSKKPRSKKHKHTKRCKLSPRAKKFLRRKIRELPGEGRAQKQAVAIAYSLARKKGLKVPPRVLTNPVPMLGTLAFVNPTPTPRAKSKGKRKRSSGPLARWLTAQPKGFFCTWKEIPLEVRKADEKARKAAIKWARIFGTSLGDVPVRRSKVEGYWVAGGKHVAHEYEVQVGERAGKLYRHEAGDNGRGRKKTAAPAIAQNVDTGLIALIPLEGTKVKLGRRGFEG